MNRRMRILVNTLLLSLTTAAVAQQKPSNTIRSLAGVFASTIARSSRKARN